jgi:dTDP-glucose 4,6-dehydratase
VPERTVIVTGGCGFIGSHFVSLLRDERPDWRVVVVDNLTYAGNPDNLGDLAGSANFQFVRADIADAPAISQLFDAERPDYVVHMAAESHVDRSILDAAPFLTTNILGTQVILDASRATDVSRVLHVSTDEVYGDAGHEGALCSETSPIRASSPYAASKAGGDLLVQAYHRTYDMPVLIARPCNHYGPRQFPEKLIPFMLRNLLERKPLPVYGDGRQERDWLFVEDGARALLSILEDGEIGASYNIAAHQERPNIEVIAGLCSMYARYQGCSVQELRDSITFVPDRPGHDVRYALDDWRLRSHTGWEPRVAFEEGLERTVAWYLTNRAWLDESMLRQAPGYYDSVYVRGWRRE